jgi:hypothetical protein
LGEVGGFGTGDDDGEIADGIGLGRSVFQEGEKRLARYRGFGGFFAECAEETSGQHGAQGYE